MTWSLYFAGIAVKFTSNYSTKRLAFVSLLKIIIQLHLFRLTASFPRDTIVWMIYSQTYGADNFPAISVPVLFLSWTYYRNLFLLGFFVLSFCCHFHLNLSRYYSKDGSNTPVFFSSQGICSCVLFLHSQRIQFRYQQ